MINVWYVESRICPNLKKVKVNFKFLQRKKKYKLFHNYQVNWKNAIIKSYRFCELFVGDTKFWPYSVSTLCFSFVESESTLELILSCASLLWFLLLLSTVKLICMLLYWSNLLLHMRTGALSGGFLEAHNFSCSYPQQYRLELLRDVGTGGHWGHVPPKIFQ